MWSGGTTEAWASGAFVEAVLWSTVGIIAVVFYLAASAFGMRVRNTLRARRYTAYERTWEPLLLDILADGSPDTSLLDTVARRSSRHFLKFLIRYARLLSGADHEVISRLAAPLLPSLLPDLGARSPSKRAWAVQTLATLGMETYAGEIAGALSDGSPLVSMVAARSLAGSDQHRYVGEVLANMPRFTNWNSRFLASMLASMGTEVAPALRGFLAAPGDPIDRSVAADALRLLTDPAAADVAAAVLDSIHDRELAAACLRLLRSVGGPEHLSIIRSYSIRGDPVLRALAIRVLGSIGEPVDTARLHQGLLEDDRWVAINSAQALSEAAAFDVLQAVADSDAPQAVVAREALEERVA